MNFMLCEFYLILKVKIQGTIECTVEVLTNYINDFLIKYRFEVISYII